MDAITMDLNPPRFVPLQPVVRSLNQSVSLHCTHIDRYVWFPFAASFKASNCTFNFLLTMD